jgi:hypothetical protein
MAIKNRKRLKNIYIYIYMTLRIRQTTMGTCGPVVPPYLFVVVKRRALDQLCTRVCLTYVRTQGEN